MPLVGAVAIPGGVVIRCGFRAKSIMVSERLRGTFTCAPLDLVMSGVGGSTSMASVSSLELVEDGEVAL